MASNRFKSIG